MEHSAQKQQAKAIWNKQTDRWETLKPWGVYSETFPKSGMTRNGKLFELPMSEHHTVGSVSSSLLPTVTASDYKRDGSSPSQMSRRSPAITVVDAHFPQKFEYLPTPDTNPGGGGDKTLEQRRSSGRTASVHNGVLQMLADVEKYGVHRGTRFGRYTEAVERWESLTSTAPLPTEMNSKGRPRLAAQFAEWMMGLPEGWVTSPEIGLSRAQQLKAIGNGVCPQQAYAALSVLVPRLCGKELANAG